jgi:hypothetical protein
MLTERHQLTTVYYMATNTIPYRIRISPSLLEMLKRKAADKRWSASACATILLEEVLTADPVANPGIRPEPDPEPIQASPVRFDIPRHNGQPATNLTPRTRSDAAGLTAVIAKDLPPLHGQVYSALERILRSGAFPGLASAADARAIKDEDWADAGATPGLMRALFPNNIGAERLALKTKWRTGGEVRTAKKRAAQAAAADAAEA